MLQIVARKFFSATKEPIGIRCADQEGSLVRGSAEGVAMVRYTARGGTTFLYELGRKLQVIPSDADDDMSIEIDMDDLREFIEQLNHDVQAPTDADCAAVSGD